jgi:hypothetical protein
MALEAVFETGSLPTICENFLRHTATLLLDNAAITELLHFARL